MATSSRSSRPWGWFETLGSGPGYLVKRLSLHPGCRLSLQRHRHRCEHWVVVRGEGKIEVDEEEFGAEPGSTLFIPLGSRHRASAGPAGLVIVEVQRGTELSEDDIERFQDDYGRV